MASKGRTTTLSTSTSCFHDTTSSSISTPDATIEQIVEVIDGKRMVHLRVTFDPAFVDNTYGANAVGWNRAADPAPAPTAPAKGVPQRPAARGGKSGHTFDDLVGSDHVEIQIYDGAGALAMDFKLDYVSVDPSAKCGYGTLGVDGGEGKVLLGNRSAVLAVATSIDRDLNGCGYCAFTTDSPATDAAYTPNPESPRWDYRVAYEVWLDADAFGASGFGRATVQNVHASPSKAAGNTLIVTEGECPPTWPKCVPDLASEGLNCGKPQSEQTIPDGSTGCPTGTVEYIMSEGATCVPRPLADSDGGLTCPAGYALDTVSEGRYCLPALPR